MRLVAVYQSGTLLLDKEQNIKIPSGLSLVYTKNYNEAGNFVAVFNNRDLRIVSSVELNQLTGLTDFDESLKLLKDQNIKFTTLVI